MALPDTQFLKDLTRGDILPSDKYWPQLDDILGTDKSHPFTVRDNTGLWKRAGQWMYCNPNEPWAPETEQLFRLDFVENAAIGAVRTQNRLLRTWTRFGTYAPSLADQRLIASHLKNTTGLELLEFACNAAGWASPEQQREWTEAAEAKVRSSSRSTPVSTYCYLHGDIALLSPAQKQAANRILSGAMEDYPIGFAQAQVLAKSHPEPNVWTACMMDLAWSITKNPGPDDLWTNASSAIEHLDAMLDSMPWNDVTQENTRCLVIAALMTREGNLLGMDMSAWERRDPAAWAQTKSMLPILECLHNIPAGPYDSGVAVNRLVPLVLDELQRFHVADSIEELVGPGLFSMPEMQSL